VSNEDDLSDRPFSIYRDSLSSLKGHLRRAWTSASAFTGTEDGDCDTPYGEADYGEGYIDLARATGGRVISMCTASYSAALGELAAESFGVRKSFPLSSTPAAAPSSVLVGGVAASFAYDPEGNTIRFPDAAAPPAGATIEIAYSAACN
jgi:hypothetical protein